LIHFDGEFRVPGEPADVLTRFADVPRMAQCMPGASIDGRDESGLYLGSMLVAFGPKQIRFKGKVAATTDAQALRGSLHVRGAADMKVSARAEVRVSYALAADAAAAAPTTIVSLTSDAEMGGVLATFAQTGGAAVTRALMDEFALRVEREFAKDAAPPAVVAATPMPSEASGAQSRALPAHRLLWQLLKMKVAALLHIRLRRPE